MDSEDQDDNYPEATKFHGKFTDLIPGGFVFQKLFANNYRQYCIRENNEKYGRAIRIWQAHGGYVEIQDLFEYSTLIFKAFSDPVELEKYKSRSKNLYDWYYYKFYINQKTHKLEFADYNDPKNAYCILNRRMNNASPDDPKYNEYCDEFYETYREFIISDKGWLFKYIKHMINIGWVKP